MTAEKNAPTAPAPEQSASRYSYFVLGLLTLVYTFNFIDRQIIAILSPAIKEDLGLSDSVLGLLKGLAFAVLYTTLGIPIAWAADRWNRVNIVAVSLGLWSAFTALSGLAMNATQLMLARLGVGIGEAGGSPPAHSLISDYFPKEKRASALAIYSLGIPFGQMFAFLAGGWVLSQYGWRGTFFIVGVPGVLLAILLKLAVKEPIRGVHDGAAAAVKVGFKQGLAHLLSIPTYWGVTIAVTFASFTGYGTAMWIVDFYRRTYELGYLEITVPLGILNGVVYGIGTWAGGWLTDRFGKNDKGAYAWLPGLGMLLTIPVGWATIWAPAPFWAFFWSAPFLIGLGFYLGPSFSLVQTLAPVRFRAVATAFFFFILNLIALGFGPLWVGALSDIFAASYGDVTGLRLALTTLGGSSLLAAIAFFWTARKLPADWAKATGESVS
ncbi:spinster family MFS transporter [Hyphococcus luteus]|uniref:MFS transporter n=1 Tax=Hyphococcus luteus TaxID=2058213 RepID=A0A2S7JZ48_9PROT|nr:MFS transporter [Marinicaulis flavus]PQA85486.1 MFS transporter [Marinicaulis flavus]